jgi:hypothetical protein
VSSGRRGGCSAGRWGKTTEGQVAVAGGGGEEGFSGGPCGSRHWSLCLVITARVISSWL